MTICAIHDRDDRVSVVMATCNGVPHLRQQVASLFAQTRLPDELVVYDDASIDGSGDLLRRMASQAPFVMRVIEGKRNLGVNRAFQAAVEACDGDIVFFCDQDDIWLPNKVETCLKALAAAPRAAFAFSDAIQFNATTADLGVSLWELARFTSRRQAFFAQHPLAAMLGGGNFVYGMASAFRRDLLDRFLPVDCDAAGMTHDTWFALHAVATGRSGIAIAEPLVRYRRHEKQTSIVLGGSTADREARRKRAQARAAAEIEAMRKVRHNVERDARSRGRDAAPELLQLDRKIAFLEAREDLRIRRSVPGALKAMVNPEYWRQARGPASVLRDYRGTW